MTDNITIRNMRSHDISNIIAISNGIVGKDRVTSWKQSLESSLGVYPMICLIADINGEIVGFLIGDTSNWEYGLPPCAWIQMIGVKKEYQGKGIGKMLLQQFNTNCKQDGFKLVQAFVRKDDERLCKFFGASGFDTGQLLNFQMEL